MSIPARKQPESEVHALRVCVRGHDITSVFDEPRATTAALKCVRIYNLLYPRCAYITVDASLCGHLVTRMIQTAFIKSVFVDSAASDSHDSTFHHEHGNSSEHESARMMTANRAPARICRKVLEERF